jgi:hypothetical protein
MKTLVLFLVGLGILFILFGCKMTVRLEKKQSPNSLVWSF